MVYQTIRGMRVHTAGRCQKVVIRPVGQVVKTEASHAFNIGSNPVRVTIFLDNALEIEYDCDCESNLQYSWC